MNSHLNPLEANQPTAVIAPVIKTLTEEEKNIGRSKEALRLALHEHAENLFLVEENLTYAELIKEVDGIVLDHIMPRVNHVQSHAANHLKINRTTLRKKLRQHGFLANSAEVTC